MSSSAMKKPTHMMAKANTFGRRVGSSAGADARYSAVRRAHRCVDRSAVTDRPGRSRPSVAASPSSVTRTGTRCTILVKLPVAFSGGSTLNYRAGRRRQARDMAVERLAGQHIGLDRHRHVPRACARAGSP